jgi:hypothetical protein
MASWVEEFDHLAQEEPEMDPARRMGDVSLSRITTPPYTDPASGKYTASSSSHAHGHKTKETFPKPSVTSVPEHGRKPSVDSGC